MGTGGAYSVPLTCSSYKRRVMSRVVSGQEGTIVPFSCSDSHPIVPLAADENPASTTLVFVPSNPTISPVEDSPCSGLLSYTTTLAAPPPRQ